MKNVVGKPLDALQPFIGEWAVEGDTSSSRTP
jgi:hypothetical protein